ncbi:phage tail domain-containing protein [Piscibacillus salipiscarius]|uniref:Phage tail domain-containing protein n=1 Tax=Piscibacillus salipiscarius TaxID=299480 RepID=A0ABW5Q9T8_9BACI|nr:phage tail domain-containing protein [Piscibacillus salipiscarius]
MKSELNFKVRKQNTEYDMHELGVWVESFHIHSPNSQKTTLQMPGKHGSRLMQSSQGVRTVDISMQLEQNSLFEYDELKHQIYDIFYSDDTLTIVRDLRPDREIYVIQEGDYDLENITKSDGRFELSLTMIDPYIYGKELFEPLASTAGTIINVEGTNPTQPIIELDVLAPITFALVSNGDEFMMIGQPVDVKQTPVQKEERVFYHGMESMTGWVSTNVIGEGYINGSMDFDSTGFFPVFAAPNPDEQEWHGPAMKHSLSETVQDFKADMGFRFYAESRGGSVGRIEMYGLDATNGIVFRAFIEDKWKGRDHFGVQLELGNGMVTDYLTLPKSLEDMYGRLKVFREGNKWTLIIQHLRDGTGQIVEREWRRTLTTDAVMQPVSQIQLAFQKFYDLPEEDMEVLLMRCYKLNDVQGIPYIANAGDKIVFDHRDTQQRSPEIRVNGELRNDLKDFGATPFSLQPGKNTLALLPDNAVQAILRYRPAYK